MTWKSDIDFSLLLDEVLHLVLVCDLNGKVIYANKAYMKAVNKPGSAILNHAYWPSLPRQKNNSMISAIPKKERLPREVIMPNGAVYQTSSVSIPDNKKHAYTVYLLEDITEKKKLWAALNNERNTFHTIIEKSADPIFLHDKKGKITLVNQAAYHSLGYTKQELLQKSVFDIEKGISQAKLNKIWRSAKTEKSIKVSGIHLKKDGSELPVEVNIMPINLEGKPLLLASVRDMSEHKQLEKDLRRRLAFEDHINQVATKLSNNTTLSEELPSIVKYFGELLAADQCHFFKLAPSTNDMYCIAEWCAPDISPHIDKLHKIKVKKNFPWVWNKLKKLEIIQINSVSDLPQEACLFKAILQSERVFSILILPILHKGKLLGLLEFNTINRPTNWRAEDVNLLATLSDLLANSIFQEQTAHKEKQHKKQLESILHETILAIALMTEERDPYTANHQIRVAYLAKKIATKMQLTPHQINGVYLGGLLHDIGKINVPAEILSLPKKLTYAELELIKTHPGAGEKIVKNISFKWPIKEIILQHHERLNGSGYPHGLTEKNICLEARIVTVADVFEAMVSHRPYRPARTKAEAIKELKTNSGKLYDKEAVKCCISIIKSKDFQFPSTKLPVELLDLS